MDFVEFSCLCSKTSSVLVSPERASLDVSCAALRSLPSRMGCNRKERDVMVSFVQAPLMVVQVNSTVFTFSQCFVQRFGLSGFLARMSVVSAPGKRSDSSDTCVVTVTLLEGQALVLPACKQGHVALVVKPRKTNQHVELPVRVREQGQEEYMSGSPTP